MSFLIPLATIGATAAVVSEATKDPKEISIPSISTPTVEETVPTTTEEVSEVTEEQAKEISKKKKGTILTSSQGILTPLNIGKKTLLGE